MDNIEYRAVIKYLLKKNLSAKEIHDDMKNTLGGDAPSYSTVCRWINEFKRGKVNVEDEPRTGRPKTVTTPDIVDKVHDIVLNDRRLKLSEIAEMVKISKERVHFIITQELDMHKLSARWVPRLLSAENKRVRCQMSQAGLATLNKNRVDFFRRFVTMDETWVHYYTPETKEQSKQWVKHGDPAPKKAKTVASAGKVMASVFWDAKGILLIDYLPKGQTISGGYYTILLERVVICIREKRPGLTKKKILYHHDNAPAHSSGVARQKLADLRFEIVNHPPYSPDLAPSDFHLFPNLKKFLAGKRFHSDEEVKLSVNEYFDGLEENYFREGIEKLEHRWNKCIELRGDYVEK